MRACYHQHRDENINFNADFKSYLAHCELLNCNDEETALKLSNAIEIIIDQEPRPTLENWLFNQKSPKICDLIFKSASMMEFELKNELFAIKSIEIKSSVD